MFFHSDFPLDLVLAEHQGRIAAARRWRRVARSRRARREWATQSARPQPTTTTRFDDPFRIRHNVGLAQWLIRVGDVVVRYPTAELDGHRRPALGILVNELLDIARDCDADVTPPVTADDSAVVVLRTLGRLAESTGGGPIPVSRRRARILQTALDDLINDVVDDLVDPVTGSPADQAA